MVFKDFRTKILYRIGLLVVFIALACWGFLSEKYLTIGILGAVLALGQVAVLFHFAIKTHKDILNFLASIQYNDFSVTYPTKMHTGLTKKLHHEYNRVIAKFRELRNEKESALIFYKTIMQQIDTGIIALDNSGGVQVANAAALQLLKVNRLNHISTLATVQPEIYNVLLTLLPRQKKVLKLSTALGQLSISFYANEMMVNGAQIKVVSIQNIQSELEDNEMEAWQNMIRVMTHEIMNSLTPITSLAATVLDEMLASPTDDAKNTDAEEKSDLILALTTIKKRSEGLLHFVDDFRNLSQIPKPKPALFSLKSFFDHLMMLFKNDFEQSNVAATVSIEPESINLMADRMLLEQVVINIIKNSLESFQTLEHAKRIDIKAHYTSESRIEISIKDNGAGIIEEVIEKVFIPFYSTKKSGSGIGLTICKQIMQSHGGNIKISSRISEGTTVRLIF